MIGSSCGNELSSTAKIRKVYIHKKMLLASEALLRVIIWYLFRKLAVRSTVQLWSCTSCFGIETTKILFMYHYIIAHIQVVGCVTSSDHKYPYLVRSPIFWDQIHILVA